MNARVAFGGLIGLSLLAAALWLLPQRQQVASIVDLLAPRLEGQWRSADDALYVMTFTSEGKLLEAYDNAALSEGTYVRHNVVTYEGEELTGDFISEQVSGATYLYRIDTLTSDTLRLFYVERGEALTFTRITP